MLKYYFSIMLLFFSMVAVAQTPNPTFQANSIIKKDVETVLHQQFFNFQLYQLPIEKIHSHASTSDRSDFKIETNTGISWDIELQAYDIRSNNYAVSLASEKGIETLNKVQKNITYRGQLANMEGSDVRLTIAPGFFYGLVETNSTTFYIEPLSYFVKNAPSNQFVIYEEADVIPKTGKTCGVTEAQKRKEEIEKVGKEKNDSNTLTAMTCFDVELAIASDFSMYTLSLIHI